MKDVPTQKDSEPGDSEQPQRAPEEAPVEGGDFAPEEPWPANEAPTDGAGEWVKPCGCPGGWNEHHLDCPEVQNYL